VQIGSTLEIRSNGETMSTRNEFNRRIVNEEYIMLLNMASEVVEDFDKYGEVRPAMVEHLRGIIKSVRKQTPTVLLEAAQAVRARRDENWDHPALVKCGSMTKDAIKDMKNIILTASTKQITEALKLAGVKWPPRRR
jgi:hypothetical protein